VRGQGRAYMMNMLRSIAAGVTALLLAGLALLSPLQADAHVDSPALRLGRVSLDVPEQDLAAVFNSAEKLVAMPATVQPVEPRLGDAVLPSPASPARPATGGCPVSGSSQTWTAKLRVRSATGECKRSEAGSLVIERTGETTALVVAGGHYRDENANFDAATCTVSHKGWKPDAPVDVTISYAIAVDPKGGLSGGARVNVDSMIFGCSGRYGVSGARK
jgi:hypothetical protein